MSNWFIELKLIAYALEFVTKLIKLIDKLQCMAGQARLILQTKIA